MKAIYVGSFDPITKGHLDVIKRAEKISDYLTVVIAANTTKVPMFTEIERDDLIRKALVEEGLTRVAVVTSTLLTVDTARALGADTIIRGLRSVTDFEYELNLANVNKELAPEIETIFIPCDPKLSCVSSSMVKELLKYKQDISKFVPQSVVDAVAVG